MFWVDVRVCEIAGVDADEVSGRTQVGFEVGDRHVVAPHGERDGDVAAGVGRGVNGNLVAVDSREEDGDKEGPVKEEASGGSKASASRPTRSGRPGTGATRPNVERKIGHLTRRGHGGRKARCRGMATVLSDLVTRAAAINLARLATLGVHHATMT